MGDFDFGSWISTNLESWMLPAEKATAAAKKKRPETVAAIHLNGRSLNIAHKNNVTNGYFANGSYYKTSVCIIAFLFVT